MGIGETVSGAPLRRSARTVVLALALALTMPMPLVLTGCGSNTDLEQASALPNVPAGAAYGSTDTAEPSFDPFGRGKAKDPGRPKKIENPTMQDLLQVGPLGERALGKADAPVTVIEYASLTCPYCRAFHLESFAAIKKRYIDTGKVRWIIREFPIGRSSGTAWIVARCAPEKDYFKLFDLYLREQAIWVSQEVRPDVIYQIAAKTGMSRAAFDSCLANREIETGLSWVKQRGRELGVIGTPTFFVNEKQVRSVLTAEEFSAMIEPLLASKKAGSGAT